MVRTMELTEMPEAVSGNSKWSPPESKRTSRSAVLQIPLSGAVGGAVDSKVMDATNGEGETNPARLPEESDATPDTVQVTRAASPRSGNTAPIQNNATAQAIRVIERA